MTFMPSPEQQAVIDSDATVIVVIGGAGTGKTTTAAAAASRRLLEIDQARATMRAATPSGAPIGLRPRKRVLFVSFSRTAVSQILDRASGVLGDLRDRVDVVTFHGLAWRILNDFGRFYGHPHPLHVQSRAESELARAEFPGVTYDELIPAASDLLAIPTVRDYYERRYGTVICDEFQDTSANEWAFLQAVAPGAQRILLGDPNQCIYASMKKIDPNARIAQATALPGAAKFVLPPQSHRDPSGVLPAAALAALERRFDAQSIAHSVAMGRVVLHRVSDSALAEAASQIVASERAAGRTVGVFTHTQAATAELSTALSDAGLAHEQVGFAESFGDGLQAQFTMLRWALGKGTGARAALAVYVRSIGRGSTEKQAADAYLDKSDPALEKKLGDVAIDLRKAAGSAGTDDVMELLAASHRRLGLLRGEETWLQANRQLRRAARILPNGGSLEDLAREIGDLRAEWLIGSRSGRPKPVQVMNLHQTKGREADATVLLLQPDEYHGPEAEPYPTGSRLLYVCLTRARERAHVIVPANVGGIHGLWLPFVNACIAARERSPCPNEACWGEVQWRAAITESDHEYQSGLCDSCGTLCGRCPGCEDITAFDGGDSDCFGCGAVWSVFSHPRHGDSIDWAPPPEENP